MTLDTVFAGIGAAGSVVAAGGIIVAVRQLKESRDEPGAHRREVEDQRYHRTLQELAGVVCACGHSSSGGTDRIYVRLDNRSDFVLSEATAYLKLPSGDVYKAALASPVPVRGQPEVASEAPSPPEPIGGAMRFRHADGTEWVRDFDQSLRRAQTPEPLDQLTTLPMPDVRR